MRSQDMIHSKEKLKTIGQETPSSVHGHQEKAARKARPVEAKIAGKMEEAAHERARMLRCLLYDIEYLEGQVREIRDDIKILYYRAEAHGFSRDALKQVIKWRRMDVHQLDMFRHDIAEIESLLEQVRF